MLTLPLLRISPTFLKWLQARGVLLLDHSLSSMAQSDVTWKMTGSLGEEQYRDLARGLRNEGATFAERQVYHLPHPPSYS